MAKDRSLVRASDIGAWAFCQRAWWLAQVQGAEHERPQALAYGREAHRQHGLDLIRARRLMMAGLLLIVGGVVAALLYFFFWLY